MKEYTLSPTLGVSTLNFSPDSQLPTLGFSSDSRGRSPSGPDGQDRLRNPSQMIYS